jgi:hypothetical protein
MSRWKGSDQSAGGEFWVFKSVAKALAQIKVFPYYGSMNITLSLDEKLVKDVRKIAVEKDTTLTGLIRAHLEHLAAEHAASGRRRREREALERSFSQFQFRVGKKTWKREDLYVRS